MFDFSLKINAFESHTYFKMSSLFLSLPSSFHYMIASQFIHLFTSLQTYGWLGFFEDTINKAARTLRFLFEHMISFLMSKCPRGGLLGDMVGIC